MMCGANHETDGNNRKESRSEGNGSLNPLNALVCLGVQAVVGSLIQVIGGPPPPQKMSRGHNARFGRIEQWVR
jgi:hypothetical protein